MASFCKITTDQLTVLKNILAEAGYTSEEVAFLIENPNTIKTTYQSFLAIGHTSRSPLRSRVADARVVKSLEAMLDG